MATSEHNNGNRRKTDVAEESETNGFDEFYKDILLYQLDTSLLDCLVSGSVVTIQEADRVRDNSGKTKKNEVLLNILKGRPYDCFGYFMEASEKNKTITDEDLVNKMKAFNIKGQQPDVLFADESIKIGDFQVRLQKSYQTLVEQMSSPMNIADKLLDMGTLNQEDHEDIDLLTTKSKSIRKILSKVAFKSKKSGYEAFLKMMKESDDPEDRRLAGVIEDMEVTKNDKLLLQIGLSYERIDLPSDVGEVRQRVDDIETQMSEVIPANIQDQIKKKLELWQKKDKMFVSTEAAKHVLECIKENSCVTVTGNSGIGKTFVVRHVALIMQNEGYTVIPTCIPKDIRDFTQSGKKTLFVIDDIGGRFTLNQRYIDDWKLLLPDIEILLKSNCKCIATCRLQVFKDKKFKDISIFTLNECDLSSDKLCLTASEKSSLSKKYFGEQSSQVSEMSDLYDFFPLLCSLYDKDKFSDLSLFFSQPFDCYKQEVDKLLNECDDGKYKYCVLALVIMFNNKLSEDHLSPDYKKIIKNTLDKCKLNTSTSIECLKDALYTLEGTFVVKDGDFYKTVHDKLFDFLANYFGDKMLECIIDNATSEFINERILWKSPDNIETDIDFTIDLHDKYLNKYISRLVNDWSDGKVYKLFCSRNFKSPTFIVKLLDHIKQHDTPFQVKLANVTVDNNYHDTTLMASCFIGDVNLTQWILDNTVNNGRCSVLCKSVVCCNKILQWLYRDSIVNQCRDNGASPVYIACEYGHVNILKTLIENKADINKCENDGVSPVYIACQEGHVNILKTLIENKADINKCSNDGISLVNIACYKGHVNILKTLLENKADINKCDNDGRSPVCIACHEGHVNILKTLIENKADINKCDNDGVSPVCLACQNGHVNILKTLIENKADINKCNNNGVSPVYIACEYGHVNILKTLIENKADINKCDNDGISPVYIACQEGHVNILKTLIENKADINKCMNDGVSPVYIACQNGHVNILKTLIENKADINKCDNNGRSPLHIACYKNHINVVLVLLKLYKKEMIDLCDDWGDTPLHDACSQGSVQVVTPLLQHGANPHQCNSKGKSPLQEADDNGHVDVVTSIKQFISNK